MQFLTERFTMLSFITSLGAGVVIGVLILGFSYLGGSLLFMFTD